MPMGFGRVCSADHATSVSLSSDWRGYIDHLPVWEPQWESNEPRRGRTLHILSSGSRDGNCPPPAST